MANGTIVSTPVSTVGCYKSRVGLSNDSLVYTTGGYIHSKLVWRTAHERSEGVELGGRVWYPAVLSRRLRANRNTNFAWGTVPQVVRKGLI